MNKQRIFNLAFILLATILPTAISAVSVQIGSSYDDVIQELGEPDGEMEIGNKQVLTYGDAKVTLRDQSVVKISPEFESLLSERKEKQEAIQTKRDAGLISFRGQWITPEKKRRIILAESKERAEKANAALRDVVWLNNFEEASKLAKLQNKKLLLNFTGSDWCGWCIKLEKEVFSKVEFIQYAQKYYILVQLDFPKKKKLGAKLKNQNEALRKKYGVRGFPSIIVLTPSGQIHARGGYVKGGPNPFIRSIL